MTGSSSTARRSSLIFLAIGSGVPGGPISAKKPSARGIAGSVSAMVGVSGRFGRRRAEPTASSLSVPPLIEPATKQRFEDIASYVNPMSGPELLAYIRTEQALWKPVIEQISTFKAAPK